MPSCMLNCMRSTLTIRIAPGMRKELKFRATQAGLTVSSFVREILRRALEERSVRVKAGQLEASLRIKRATRDPWARQIRERNWRR